jgi:gluconolactonase
MVIKGLSVLATVGVVAAQSLLQALPSQYANRSDIVYIANNLAVIPPPFNYTGGLYLESFTSFNVSNASFAAELNEAGNASFFIFDPRFIDIIGPNPQLELFFNLSTNVHEAPSYLPEQNVVFFSELETANQFFIELNNTPPTLRNITFKPPIFSINGGTYAPRDGKLYLAANGGNGTVPAVWQADPVAMTSKVLVNNYRGLHLNSPDDVVVNNSTGLVYFTDPFYAYVLPNNHYLTT